MPHHSSCHKPQMSTVWFLLSISIWKVPSIMCQYTSIMFDSRDWACTEILAFFFSPLVLSTFPIDSISKCGLGKHGGHLCHITSVCLCFGGLAKKIFWCYEQLPLCVSGQQGPQHSFWMDIHLMETPKRREEVWHKKLNLDPIRTSVQTQNQARIIWAWFCETYLFFKMQAPGRFLSSLSTWKERWSS